MAYTPTEWNNGDLITAEKLNHMEGGISTFEITIMSIEPNADQSISRFTATIDKTYNEIREAILAGKRVVVNYSPGGDPTGGMVLTCPLIGYSKIRIDDEVTPSGSMMDDTAFLFGCANSSTQCLIITISYDGYATIS